MNDISILDKYFDLSNNQKAQYVQLVELIKETNQRINLISRKNEEFLVEQHILHSLAIAAFYPFSKGATVLDVGTGGGFPGLPLAIMFPEVHFTLIDGTLKKIKSVQENALKLGLTNVTAKQIRAEELKGKFDFVVSRAVTSLDKFTNWVFNNIDYGSQGGMHRGIYYLRGLDFDFDTINSEINPDFDCCIIESISDVFKEPFFETKKLVVLKKI